MTFHYSNSDAEAGTPSLPLQYQNGSANLQTIYVRVFNPTTGCYVVTTLTLEVVANPVLNMPLDPYVICSGSYGTINIFLYGKLWWMQPERITLFLFTRRRDRKSDG